MDQKITLAKSIDAKLFLKNMPKSSNLLYWQQRLHACIDKPAIIVSKKWNNDISSLNAWVQHADLVIRLDLVDNKTVATLAKSRHGNPDMTEPAPFVVDF